jgi:hypothetical protein
MANSDAWQAGIDIATGRRGKKKDDAADDSASTKPTGGLLGMAGKAIQKMRGKGKNAGGAPVNQVPQDIVSLGTFKKGGPVKRTGVALLHRGEYVIPAKGKSRRKVISKRTTVKG